MDPAHPVGRLCYTKVRGEWSHYGSDRNLKFREYDLMNSTPQVSELMAEVERDPDIDLLGLTHRLTALVGVDPTYGRQSSR